MDFFLNPPVVRTELKWREPDKDELMRILVEEHEFGRERIESAIKKLEASRSAQSRLDKWTKR